MIPLLIQKQLKVKRIETKVILTMIKQIIYTLKKVTNQTKLVWCFNVKLYTYIPSFFRRIDYILKRKSWHWNDKTTFIHFFLKKDSEKKICKLLFIWSHFRCVTTFSYPYRKKVNFIKSTKYNVITLIEYSKNCTHVSFS